MRRLVAARGWLKDAIRALLPKGRFARSVTVLAGGAAIGQGVTVLVSPILTRIYSPGDFGVFGVYSSILGIASVASSLRYEYAIPLPKDDRSAGNSLALCFALLFGMTIVVWSAIQGLHSQIVVWTKTPGLNNYLWLVPLGMLGGGAYRILNYWAVRKKDFVRIAKTRINRGVARAFIQVGLGFMSSGPLGLLLGELAGGTAGTASLGLGIWNKDRGVLKTISLQGILRAAARYRRFAFFSSWADLLEVFAVRAPQLLFAAFYGADVAGWFILGQQVIAAPLDLAAKSVTQAYFGEAARLSRDDPDAMRKFFLWLTTRLVLIGGFPVVAISVAAPWFFSVIFGSGWETSAQYVQILGLMLAVRFAVVPLSNTLNILERQDLFLIWDATRLALVVGGLVAVKTFGSSHIGAVMVYSLSMLISYGFLWGMIWYALGRMDKARDSKV